MAEWDATGRSSWVSDLAEIPAKYGVKNVYGDLGQISPGRRWRSRGSAPPSWARWSRVSAPITSSGAPMPVWTGAPQWQIEALRRLEIPEDMQKKYGFTPLGPADGPVKTAIFGENNARLYGYKKSAGLDRFDQLKADYDRIGPEPSNLRYGYVRKPA